MGLGLMSWSPRSAWLAWARSTALATLPHPNIATLYGMEESGDGVGEGAR
jgi:hypothetical protein